MKVAEQTPLTALRVGELALEAGVPKGVLNVLTGDGPVTGNAVASHLGVDKVSCTKHSRMNCNSKRSTYLLTMSSCAWL